MLEWPLPFLNIHLGGTFNVDEKMMCNVGYFNHNCGDMHSKPKKYSPSDVITLNQLGRYEYLFYVEHLGESNRIR